MKRRGSLTAVTTTPSAADKFVSGVEAVEVVEAAPPPAPAPTILPEEEYYLMRDHSKQTHLIDGELLKWIKGLIREWEVVHDKEHPSMSDVMACSLFLFKQAMEAGGESAEQMEEWMVRRRQLIRRRQFANR